MREILFRGFHECENGNKKAYYGGEWHKGKWVCGCYVDTGFEHYIIPKEESVFTGGINEMLIECNTVAPETVCQYTGLDDKNGKKIFEGDIVKYCGNKQIVVFEQRNNNAFFGIAMSENETWKFENIVPCKKMEVIGNEFKNPELLEVEK